MENSTRVKLPSGAELIITLSPFKTAKALYQAIAEEAKSLQLKAVNVKGLSLDSQIDVGVLKDLLCTALASKRIEDAVAECFKRCTYDGLRITDDTFEPEAARQDYIQACFEVAKANIAPFLKSLMQQFAPFLEQATEKIPA